ncbi:MAG TPA: hypothetical protein VFY40_23775 [Blastocatellia bacterium]|nr:hypothetical protein [Blastocatellia bacterium]
MKKFKSIARRSVSIAAGAAVAPFLLTGIAFAQTVFQKAPGVWLSGDERKPTAAHVEELAQSLRRISGFSELHFANDGSLSLGAAQAAQTGSAAARDILTRSLGSRQVFIIEDHSGSPFVNFGQLNEGLRYEDAITGLRLMVWRVRLDFDDFREMQASREVRDSFDVGFTALHELLHGLGYKDAAVVGDLGECEETLNQAREELALPLRDQYFGDELRMARYFISVRLRFRSRPPQSSAGATRSRIQYLFFMVHSEPGQQGVAAFDCGNGTAIRREAPKDQRAKREELKDQKARGLRGD